LVNIQKDISLKNLNTFGLEVKAKYFAEIFTIDQLQEILQNYELKKIPLLILGGGSNILFTGDFEGLVLKINIKGTRIIKEDNELVYLKTGAGVNWHEFVMDCLEKGYAGIENLSLIPGTIGAAPMQNIGAYGVEIMDVFEELEAVDVYSGKLHIFNNAACQFGYRNSIFKDKLKSKFIIVNVTLKLKKKPDFNVSYGAIQDTLNEMGVQELSIKAVSNAVIKIRQSKLPDPAIIGNAGSFFKNPTIPLNQYNLLKAQYPEIPGYVVDENTIKVPAGWLIEKGGWKGKVIGEAGVHKHQALVLVNLGNAQGKDILKLAMEIQTSIQEKFGIVLSPEVNII
jgi:UDP-N-acetylmuramate dehydrogenase